VWCVIRGYCGTMLLSTDVYWCSMPQYAWYKICTWSSSDSWKWGNLLKQDGDQHIKITKSESTFITHFSHRWTGQRISNEYRPLTPYLTPRDFFLWDYIKESPHRTKTATFEELRHAQSWAVIPEDTSVTFVNEMFAGVNIAWNFMVVFLNTF
jgi:hypothetical protein